MPLAATDTLAILDLIDHYCHAVDTGDGPAYADTFLPNGTFEMPAGRVEGRDALIEMVGVIQAAMPGVRHLSTNWVIDGPKDGDPDSATMRCYMLIKAHDPQSDGKARPSPSSSPAASMTTPSAASMAPGGSPPARSTSSAGTGPTGPKSDPVRSLLESHPSLARPPHWSKKRPRNWCP